VIAALLICAACGTHAVPAAATDRAITGDRPSQPNRVWAPPPGRRRHRLLVHFPGSDGGTSGSDLLAQQMASDGFHVIDLAYDPSGLPVRSVCRAAQALRHPDCAVDFRGERFYGAGGPYNSRSLSIDRAHSVMNRLIKLLGYLTRTYRREGWGSYVSHLRSRVYGGFKPRFDRLLTSGHSQGAGMALFTAREKRVLRVGMFGGANDYTPVGGGSITVANWIRGPFATPKSRIFGFSHTLETGHAGQLAVWAALKLPGGPASVDGSSAPFGASHRLVTSRMPRCGSNGCSRGEYHSSTIIDGVTPRSAPGVPAYGPVWRYMLTPRARVR
jgi:hypothetical protein